MGFERFDAFLADLRRYQDTAVDQKAVRLYTASNEANQIVYTIQQAIGSIGEWTISSR